MAIEDRYTDIGFRNAAAKASNKTIAQQLADIERLGSEADALATKAETSSINTAAAAGLPVLNVERQPTAPKAPTGFTYQWISLPGSPGSGEYRLIQNTPTGGGGGAGGGGGLQPTGLKTEEQIAAETAAAQRQAERQSAYDLLYSQFSQYGLESLVEPLRGLIVSGASPAEFTIRLRESEPYKKRFAANAQRISKGLRALNEADYLALEDQYQEVMRQYGLPESYYTKDATGKQVGFEQLIANDVSNLELGDRLMVAQDRVLKSNPEVMAALKQFYPDINNGDILAYTLDPKNAIKEIQRKVTAAEIGGAAMQTGLSTNLARAEELGRYGVDKAAAEKGFTTIGAGLQRGSQLASIYSEDPYTQQVAESEIFNIPGAQEARKQRQKITGLERATFGGQTGITQGTLARDRAGAY
jgi:hypothetical protein